LLDADAVLAGHAAADANALVENLVTCRQHALHLIGVALVEQQDWMKVAVAGVEDVAHAETILLANASNFTQHVRQLRARHDAILRAITRRQPADGAERLLARLPQ